MSGGRALLLVACVGTALIAAWLAFVIVAVLPDRSPTSIPTWTAICALAGTAVIVGVAWLVRPGRALVAALRVVAVATAVVGGWLAAAWLLTPPDQEGEGYLLLIGGWLVLHGIAGVLAPAIDARSSAEATGGVAAPR